jgi:cytochrome c-type protein NapC
MKETDSRECRNCHDWQAMDYTEQRRRSVAQHIKGFDEHKTCIDCHKGIAHSLPNMIEDDPSAALVDTKK